MIGKGREREGEGKVDEEKSQQEERRVNEGER